MSDTNTSILAIKDILNQRKDVALETLEVEISKQMGQAPQPEPVVEGEQDLHQLVKTYPQAEDAALDFLKMMAAKPSANVTSLLQQAAKTHKTNAKLVAKVLKAMGFDEIDSASAEA